MDPSTSLLILSKGKKRPAAGSQGYHIKKERFTGWTNNAAVTTFIQIVAKFEADFEKRLVTADEKMQRIAASMTEWSRRVGTNLVYNVADCKVKLKNMKQYARALFKSYPRKSDTGTSGSISHDIDPIEFEKHRWLVTWLQCFADHPVYGPAFIAEDTTLEPKPVDAPHATIVEARAQAVDLNDILNTTVSQPQAQEHESEDDGVQEDQAAPDDLVGSLQQTEEAEDAPEDEYVDVETDCRGTHEQSASMRDGTAPDGVPAAAAAMTTDNAQAAVPRMYDAAGIKRTYRASKRQRTAIEQANKDANERHRQQLEAMLRLAEADRIFLSESQEKQREHELTCLRESIASLNSMMQMVMNGQSQSALALQAYIQRHTAAFASASTAGLSFVPPSAGSAVTGAATAASGSKGHPFLQSNTQPSQSVRTAFTMPTVDISWLPHAAMQRLSLPQSAVPKSAVSQAAASQPLGLQTSLPHSSGHKSSLPQASLQITSIPSQQAFWSGVNSHSVTQTQAPAAAQSGMQHLGGQPENSLVVQLGPTGVQS